MRTTADRLLNLAATLERDWPLWLADGYTVGEDGRGFARAGDWTDDWNAWLILWPDGVAKGPHDYDDSSALYIPLVGSVRDRRWGPASTALHQVRDRIFIPPRTVHDVWAERGWALGLHLYSPPLTRMNLYGPDGVTRIGEEHVER